MHCADISLTTHLMRQWKASPKIVTMILITGWGSSKMKAIKIWRGRPWGGLNEQEYAWLRYMARKHLDARMRRK